MSELALVPAKGKPETLIVVGIPRADLLPPEVALEAKAQAQRRSMLALIILLIVVVGAAYGAVTYLTSNAQASFEAAQARTTVLLKEQAKYSEIKTLSSKVSGIESDQKIATSTEIDWKSYLKAVEAKLPTGSTFQTVSVASSTPLTPLSATSGLLGPDGIAEIILGIKSEDVPDIVKLVDSLTDLPGYTDATPNNVTRDEDGYYLLSVTIHVSNDALSNRFKDEEAAK